MLTKAELAQLTNLGGVVSLYVPVDDVATLIRAAPARLRPRFEEAVRNHLDPDREAYVEAAQQQYGKDGEIEIDDNADFSPGSDPGAYVAAWVWVYAKDAGVDFDGDEDDEEDDEDD